MIQVINYLDWKPLQHKVTIMENLYIDHNTAFKGPLIKILEILLIFSF